MMYAPGFGDCCNHMDIALDRRSSAHGIDIGTSVNTKTGVFTDALVYHLRQARKGDDGKYGHGKPHGRLAMLRVRFCPFCGVKMPDRDYAVKP